MSEQMVLQTLGAFASIGVTSVDIGRLLVSLHRILYDHCLENLPSRLENLSFRDGRAGFRDSAVSWAMDMLSDQLTLPEAWAGVNLQASSERSRSPPQCELLGLEKGCLCLGFGESLIINHL